MKKMKEFGPVEGVTLDNCLRYILAVEQAAVRDIEDVEPSMRSFALTSVAVALRLAQRTLSRLKKNLESEGLSTPLTKEQQIHFALMLRLSNKNPN